MRKLIATLATVLFAAAGASDAAPLAGDWQEYTHPRLQFRIMYPAGLFAPDSKADNADGLALVSADGSARLLIGAFDNEEATTLAEYRRIVLERSYKGAKVDYAPVRRNWFVVSGERDGWMFYERVQFACEGRRITSWAMVYPVAERQFYDRIVERVAPTFRPSAGPAAGC